MNFRCIGNSRQANISHSNSKASRWRTIDEVGSEQEAFGKLTSEPNITIRRENCLFLVLVHSSKKICLRSSNNSSHFFQKILFNKF
jgi:hypothetical protein